MAATKYAYSVSTDFPNAKVNIDSLTDEIQASTITVALDYINVAGDDCDIWFKAAITGAEETTLDGIVAAHTGAATVDQQLVHVAEDKSGCNAHYQCRGVSFDVPAQQTGSVELSWAYPIRLCVLHCDPCNDGDTGEATLGENTVIGAITADVAANQKTLSVSATVTANLDPGYILTLDDGTNTDDLLVTEVNTAAGTVTVHAGPTHAYAAATPTYCQVTIRMTYGNIEFKAGSKTSCGESFLGGELMPAGTKLKIRYHNSHATETARPRLKLEYWY